MKENIMKSVKVTIKYILTVVIIVSTFLLGSFYEKWNQQNVIENTPREVNINRENVSLAIDENSNLIIIDNKSGDYIIYVDSIGIDIFQLYAKNIWADQNIK